MQHVRQEALEAFDKSINLAEGALKMQEGRIARNQTREAAGDLQWDEPQSLVANIDPQPYPIDALPLPVRKAVEEVAGFVKAPVPLVVSSALTAISLAVQAHVDVKRDEKLQGPTGLYLLCIADSGERKSTCDGYFTKPIRDYQKRQEEAAKPELDRYNADLESWEAKRSGIKDTIRQLAKENKSTHLQEQAMQELERDKPEPPRIPKLLYSDTTPEALGYGLSKQWPSAGVVSAEAGAVFGSHGMGKDSLMRNLSLLNQLWDGASMSVERRTTESFTVSGRLTVGLQIQQATFLNFHEKNGDLARGSGFIARFLVSFPESTQGTRTYSASPESWPYLDAFNRRISDLLDLPAPVDDDGNLVPAILSLTPEAKNEWIGYHNAIEAGLKSGAELHEIRDIASKSPDNAARLAALFHVFGQGTAGGISADCMHRACQIAAWHLSESRRFMGELALPSELLRAKRLDDWLIQYCRENHTHIVPVTKIQQYGPGGSRSKARMEEDIRVLSEACRARYIQDGKRKSIAINPALLEERKAI